MMEKQPDFKFQGNSIAQAYDSMLVPVLFDPWAEILLDQLPPREGWSVLDLATGTGIVAEKLADRVGVSGSVTACDLSPEMLEFAKARCRETTSNIIYIESPAHPLDLSDETFDAVYCQQGFQFFPDRSFAAREMHRVTRPGGGVAIATWCPVDRCDFFGAICEVLSRCGEEDIAKMMAVPFNNLPKDELAEHFIGAGFKNVCVELGEKELAFEAGIDQAYETIYATPIGPKLRELPEERRIIFRKEMIDKLSSIAKNNRTIGRMTSHILTAEKGYRDSSLFN